MSNGLLYIAGLVSLALAALFAVPYFIDWNGYRGVFEEEATRILGREVRVGGNVNVRLLPAPFVRFDKLRIADTSGTARASRSSAPRASPCGSRSRPCSRASSRPTRSS